MNFPATLHLSLSSVRARRVRRRSWFTAECSEWLELISSPFGLRTSKFCQRSASRNFLINSSKRLKLFACCCTWMGMLTNSFVDGKRPDSTMDGWVDWAKSHRWSEKNVNPFVKMNQQNCLCSDWMTLMQAHWCLCAREVDVLNAQIDFWIECKRAR